MGNLIATGRTLELVTEARVVMRVNHEAIHAHAFQAAYSDTAAVECYFIQA